MIITRNLQTVNITMVESDFVDSGVHVESANQRGAIYDAGEVTVDGSEMTITIEMNSAIYAYVANIASGERKFKSQGFGEEESRRISDEFLAGNFHIADYEGSFDVTDSEIRDTLDEVVIADKVVFTGNFIAGANYILRADVSVRDIDFYLIPTSMFKDPTPGDNTFVDSFPIVIPSAEGDGPVSDEIKVERVTAFKVAIIDKDIVISGRRKALSIITVFMGLVHRHNYVYGDIEALYRESISLFQKFDFMSLPDEMGTHLPNPIFGVVASANGLAVADISVAEISDRRAEHRIGGTVPTKIVVGDIHWPTRIEFKEQPPTFDKIREGDADWEKYGPIQDAYINGSNVPIPECMHSWEGRGGMGLRSIDKLTAGIEDD